MENRCLYCYEPLETGLDFHEKCSLRFFGTPTPPVLDYTIDQMHELAEKIVERSIAVPGVQPKLSLSVVKEATEKANTRLTVIGTLGGQYILKPPSAHYAEMPQNEHVTMRIAEAVGIRVVQSSLIRLASGELSYITKRIDRTPEGEKIHMLDMFQITEAYDKYKSSMEKIGKAIGVFSANTLLDKIFYFELVLFSFLSGNNDMHLKNFSMIESSGWVLAPAYDLLNASIVLPDDKEELALPLNGKKQRLSMGDFRNFGAELGLTERQITAALNRFVKNKPEVEKWINQSFLSDKMKDAYVALVKKRYHQLGL